MKRIIRLTESDLTRIVRRVINEQETLSDYGIREVVYPESKIDPYFSTEDATITIRDKNGKEIRYQCVTDPAVEKGMKSRKMKNPETGKFENIELDTTRRGTIYDLDYNTLKYSKTGNYEYLGDTMITRGWEKFIPTWCRRAYGWYAEEKQKLDLEAQQIANAEAEKIKRDKEKKRQSEINKALSTGKIYKKVVDGETRYYSTGTGPFTIGQFYNNFAKDVDVTDNVIQ